MKKFLFLVALAACGGSKSEPVAPTNNAGSASATADGGAAAYHQKVLVDMSAFRDRICACADKPCGEKVMDDFNAWGAEMTKNPAADSPPPDELQPKLTEASDGFYECKNKVMGDQ